MNIRPGIILCLFVSVLSGLEEGRRDRRTESCDTVTGQEGSSPHTDRIPLYNPCPHSNLHRESPERHNRDHISINRHLCNIKHAHTDSKSPPVRVTSSPSFRKVLVSPLPRSIVFDPRHESSSKEPKLSGSFMHTDTEAVLYNTAQCRNMSVKFFK